MNSRNESLYTDNIEISKIIYTKFIFFDLTGSHEQCELGNTTDFFLQDSRVNTTTYSEMLDMMVNLWI